VEELAHWGEDQPFHGDSEQATILASFNAKLFRRLEEDDLEYINDTHFKYAVEISCHLVAMEDTSCLLMVAERQRLLEMNAQRQARGGRLQPIEARPKRGVSPVAGGSEGAALLATSNVVGGHAPSPDARSKGGEVGTGACDNKGENNEASPSRA
jgi:hypothetical protein